MEVITYENKKTIKLSITMEDDYSWAQDLQDWENAQDEYERLGLSDEWEDGIPPKIQELINRDEQD